MLSITSKLKFGSVNCARPCKIFFTVILLNSDIQASHIVKLMWLRLQRYWLYLASQKILVSCKGVFPKKSKETNNQGQVRKKSYQSILPQKSIKFSSNEDKWRNNKLRQKIVILNHSMARANLNKSKKVLTSTITASKYILKRPRICINWKPVRRQTHCLFF